MTVHVHALRFRVFLLWLWTLTGDRRVSDAQVYLGRCALRYAKVTGEPEDNVVSRFNGLVCAGCVARPCEHVCGQQLVRLWRPLPPQFFSSFQFNGFVGNIIAAIAFTGNPKHFNKASAPTRRFGPAALLPPNGPAVTCVLSPPWTLLVQTKTGLYIALAVAATIGLAILWFTECVVLLPLCRHMLRVPVDLPCPSPRPPTPSPTPPP
jgi:hypothetical protein